MWCRNIRPHRCLTYLQRCTHNSSIREQQLLNLCLKRVHLQTHVSKTGVRLHPMYVYFHSWLQAACLGGSLDVLVSETASSFHLCLIPLHLNITLAFGQCSDSDVYQWLILSDPHIRLWLNTTPLLSVYYVTQRIKDLSSTATPSN